MQTSSSRSTQEFCASRGLALSGAAAESWFSGRGQRPIASTSGPVRLFADEIRASPFRVARIWHTPLHFTRDPHPAGAEAPPLTLITVVDGALEIGTSGGPTRIPTGSSVILPSDPTITIGSAAPTGRIELQLPGPTFTGAGASRALPPSGTPLQGSDFSRILVLLANSVLASEIAPVDAGWSGIARAVEDTALALLRSSLTHRSSPLASSAEAELFARALSVIDARASDPAFTVAHLAQGLMISSARVTQVFAVHGTTAQAQIRVVRTTLAQRLLEERRATSVEEQERIARTAGFRTARTMMASIRRLRSTASGSTAPTRAETPSQ